VTDSPLAAARSTPWRRIVRDAVRYDGSGLTRAAAVRVGIGTAAPLAVGYALGSWASGAAAAGGALAVGIGSVIPAPRPRVALLLATAAGMALGTFAGAATGAHPILHVVTAALLAVACGMLAAVEPSATGVGVNTLIAFVVYGRFVGPPAVAGRTASLVAAGALVQFLLAVLARRRPYAGRALTGISAAYAVLADFAGDLRADRSSLPVVQRIDVAAQDVAYSFRTSVAGSAWQSLVAEAHRVRLELLSLANARAGVPPESPASALLDRLAAATTDYLRFVARSLAAAELAESNDSNDEALDMVELAADQLAAMVDGVVPWGERAGAPLVRAASVAEALAGQLRAIDALVGPAVSARAKRPGGVAVVRSTRRISAHGAEGLHALLERIAANLDLGSDAFRHALRLALVFVATTTATHAVGLNRGYWAAMTAVIVLRPEFAITFTRGVGRAIGTVLGVVVATGLAIVAHPHGWALVVLVGVFTAAAAAFFNASYALFTVFITGTVVFLLAGIDSNEVSTGVARLVATVGGAAAALIAYAAWPTWGRRPVAQTLADLAEATHRYVVAVLRSYDQTSDGPPLATLSRAVRLARTNTEAALDRSLADPHSRRFDAARAASMLAALRRLSIAAHTLRLRPDGGERQARTSPPTPAYGRFVDALDAELGAIVRRVRLGDGPDAGQPLRERYRDLRQAVADQGAQTASALALLVAECDELVDAAHSLTAALAGDAPAPGE
jgi:hypothetical protein